MTQEMNTANGTKIEYTTIGWNSESDSEIEGISILMWQNLDSQDEYDATLAKFSIDAEKKILKLEHVSIKRKYSAWDDSLTNPSRFVTDRMKRKLRAFMREETGEKWRVKL